MASYLLRRTARGVVTIWLVLTFTFGMIRVLPGGPLSELRAKLIRQGYPPQQVNSLIETYQNLQPNAPLYEQYYQYMVSLVHGDLGQSLTYAQSVSSIIADAAPWTIFVMMVSTIIIFALATIWGALMAYNESSRFDSASSGISILISSIPFYVSAIGLIVVFGYMYQLFPVHYRMSPGVSPEFSVSFVVDVLYHAMLPIASVVITGVGLPALSMRGNSISVLGADHVRVAQLRGLSNWRISTRYVARNAVLPMYTGFLTAIGFNLGGSVILEQIFAYPGMGYYLFEALQNRDYPLMMGVFLVITVAVVIAVYLADLTYSWVDPRIQAGDSSEAY